MKKIFITLTVLLFSLFFLFAEKAYSIRILNADSMKTDSNTVILEGNVELSFSTEQKDAEAEERNLKCGKVVINLDEKILQASGNVVLTQKDESSFRGDEIVLNWESLDVVVFGGKSSSMRNSSDGTQVEFHATGERMSYSGDLNTVYFEEGVVSTSEKDPYWSIKPRK